MLSVSALRVYLGIESDGPITFYTGKLVKTILYTLVRELKLYRGVRGIISPVHLSPLFRPGRREWELGELVSPVYVKEGDEYRLVPVHLSGEYIVHIGGASELVELAERLIDRLRTPLQLKIGPSIVRVWLEKASDVTETIMGKELLGDRLTLYLKGPVKLFNVFTKSRLPKYNVSAVEVLMTPYMFYKGQLTMSESLLLEAMHVLGLLIETYYSINTVKYVQVPLNNGKDPGLIGKITYIIDTDRSEKRRIINEVLNVAEAVGIGESRVNGFGTTTWRPK